MPQVTNHEPAPSIRPITSVPLEPTRQRISPHISSPKAAPDRVNPDGCKPGYERISIHASSRCYEKDPDGRKLLGGLAAVAGVVALAAAPEILAAAGIGASTATAAGGAAAGEAVAVESAASATATGAGAAAIAGIKHSIETFAGQHGAQALGEKIGDFVAGYLGGATVDHFRSAGKDKIAEQDHQSVERLKEQVAQQSAVASRQAHMIEVQQREINQLLSARGVQHGN